MLTPDYVVLMTRTFVTLEGIASVYDPEFNIYTTALPITLRRLVSPSTKEARANLRNNVPLGGLGVGVKHEALEVPKKSWKLKKRFSGGIILVLGFMIFMCLSVLCLFTSRVVHFVKKYD